MKKLLLKLFNRFVYMPEGIDKAKMSAWLFASYKDDGFKNYYTMRKRALVNAIIIEDDPVKRAELKGGLNELKALASNIAEEYKKRKDNK